jgi:hypothetical protein
MDFLLDLWLPILASAGLVFVASSVVHMFLPIHRNDYGQLPDEDQVLDAMRSAKLSRGHYMFPFASCMEEMQSDEMMAKQKSGPVGFMTVLDPGPLNMGKSLGQWFVFTVVVSVFVAYIASVSTVDGSEIFRLTSTVAFLGYAMSYIQDSIWKGMKWSITAKFLLDGFIYALVTGATMAWLWPEAAAA